LEEMHQKRISAVFDRFFRRFQRLVEKLSREDQTGLFFFSISCVRSESDVFEPPSNRQRSSKTKSLILLLQPICHLLGRFGEDRLCGLGDREQNNKHKNERSYSTIEDAGLIIIRPFNNVFYI